MAATIDHSFYFGDLLLREADDDTLGKGQRTRVMLMLGACECLNEMPLEAMRVADICARVHASYGLFYHYFPDKETVATELLKRFIEETFAGYASLHPVEDAYQSVFEANYYYVQVYRKNSGLMRASLSGSDQLPGVTEYVQRCVQRWHSRVAKSIGGNFAGRTLSGETQLLVAYSVGGMIDELLRQIFVLENRDVAPAAKDLVALTEIMSILWYRAAYGTDPDPHAVSRMSELARQLPAPARSATAKTKRRSSKTAGSKGR